MGNCLNSWFSCFYSSNISPSTFTSSDANYSSSVAQRTTATTTSGSSAAGAARSQLFSGATSDGIDSENGHLPPPDGGRILESPSLKVFSFSDLKSTTKNFRSDTLLGEGGFGKVYRGWVDERTLAPTKPGIGIAVAIKKLKDESFQGFEEWQSEVNFLGRLSHPNLVKLLGYCWEDKELLLVYEFVQKGSLENHLFRRNATVEPLPWDLRLRIATGAARGLAFLHTSDEQVIYRDFKASNILLDSNYDAKISDFGLAKFGPAGGASHVTTRVMGTYGYAAPEYIATGHLYVKSDVYGFGVVLLELMTGLRAMDKTRPNGQHNLVEWLRPTLSRKRKLKNIMDARMEGQYSPKAMLQAAQVALKCLEPDHETRPSMKEVVEDLERIQAIKDKPMASRTGSSSGSGSNRSTNTHRHSSRPGLYHHYPTPLQ